MHVGWKRLRNGYPNRSRAAADNASNDPSTIVLNKNAELWNKNLIFAIEALPFVSEAKILVITRFIAGADLLCEHTKDAFRCTDQLIVCVDLDAMQIPIEAVKALLLVSVPITSNKDTGPDPNRIFVILSNYGISAPVNPLNVPQCLPKRHR